MCLGVAVIIPPTANIFIQLLYDLPNAPTAVAARQFPHSILEPFKALGVDTNAGLGSGAGKAKPEILAPPGVTDGALGFIDLEFESLGDEATDTFLYSACGPICAGSST